MENNLAFPNPGGIKSPTDYRADIVASAIASESATPTPQLPNELWTDFKKLGGPLDQNKTPSCVSHAIAQLIKLWWYLKTGQIVDFSPRWLHILSWVPGMSADDGRSPVQVMKMAMKYGCATTKTCPNDTNLSNPQYMSRSAITKEALAEASGYKIPGYVVLPPDQAKVRAAIQQYGAVALLFEIGPQLWTAPNGVRSWAQKDVDPIRIPQGDAVGGHEMVGCGWNASIDHVLNSWSASWANDGEADYLWNEWDQCILEGVAIADIPQLAISLVRTLPPADEFKHNFTKVLTLGASGMEVRALQIALTIDGENTYPEITGYYGEKTRQAVMAFQTKYAVASPAVLNSLQGRTVGSATMAQLNKLFNT